jgi:2-oxoglutarate ferredoxin oxidoreductase subunit delta
LQNRICILKGGWDMGRVTVDEDRCKGCGLCVHVCPRKIMQLSKTKLNAKGYPPTEVIDMDQCTACASCARICPDSVLTVEK